MALHDLVNLSCDDLDTNTTNKLKNNNNKNGVSGCSPDL